MMQKIAIIVGVDGQDGRIAFELLAAKNYKIIGLGRRASKVRQMSWNGLVDIADPDSVFYLIKLVQPDEIYYLAAFHQSSEDGLIKEYELLALSYRVNVLSYVNFLQAINECSPHTKIFYAASSLIFGDSEVEIQNEKSPHNPTTIYGISKLDGLLISRLYREKYNVFASVGILFNHESEFRSNKFISMKIVEAALKIKHVGFGELEVGNLSAEVDWGSAWDYVEAMNRILCVDYPDEFIIATGKKHTVMEFVEIAFGCVELDWRLYVRESSGLLTRKRAVLLGDSARLRSATNWMPSVEFKEMVCNMVNVKKYEKN